MVRYIIKRLFIGVVTIWALITITFFLIRIMPGSPFEADNLSQSAIEQLESTYGLDEPMWKQYILYMENLMHGDLGISYKKNVSVNTLIARGFPYTLSIGLLSIAVSAFIGILMGIWMATSKRLAVKNTLLGIATLGVSIPGIRHSDPADDGFRCLVAGTPDRRSWFSGQLHSSGGSTVIRTDRFDRQTDQEYVFRGDPDGLRNDGKSEGT